MVGTRLIFKYVLVIFDDNVENSGSSLAPRSTSPRCFGAILLKEGRRSNNKKDEASNCWNKIMHKI